MAYTFLGQPTDFWTVMSAIGTIVNTIVVVITVLFVYRQIKLAVRDSRLNGVIEMQKLVDDFSQERNEVFKTLPSELVLTSEQFPKKPPSAFKGPKYSDDEKKQMELTPQQEKAFNELNTKKRELARKVINKLNDLAQLIEDDFIDRKIFLGKYHLMIIRLCHLLEPIRREYDHGGNYGQRLLRLRQMAINYNTIIPKHRETPISIKISDVEIVIVPAIEKSTVTQRLVWDLKRRLRIYG